MSRKPVAKVKTLPIKSMQRRADSWTNLYTGAGIPGRDKLQSSAFALRAPLNYASAEVFDLYRQNWLAKRLVDDVVTDAFRSGWKLQVTGGEGTDEDLPKQWLEWMLSIRAFTHGQEGLRWAMVCGGAVGLLITDDTPLTQASQSVFATPMDLGTLQEVQQIVVIDARYAVPVLTNYTADPKSPNFGLPEMYTVTPYGSSTASPSYQVHWSRLLRFEGVPTDMLTRVGNLLWGDPIYEAAWDPLMRYGMAYQGAAICASEFGVKAMKIKSLEQMLGSDQYDKILARVRGIKMGISASGVALLDAEYEDLEFMSQPVTGLDDLLDRFKSEVAGVARIPESRLWGNQAGKVAGANEDHRLWAEYVHGWQMLRCEPPLRKLTKLWFASKSGPTGGKVPTGWAVVPEPIDPPDENRELEMRERQAKVDQTYFQMGSLESGEIRESRFGGVAYSTETTLDPAVTAAIKANDLAAAKANDKTQDEVPPAPGE